jgi:RNA polymerase sigma-70 factor, ECF subfamily
MRNELRKTDESTAADDAALARKIAQRDQAAFEALMRRYNGRLFRVARAILKDDAEAEDALQEAYLDAYRNIGQFRGDSQLATWLVRIVTNRALMRLRKQKREQVVVSMDQTDSAEDGVLQFPDRTSESPTAATLRAEARRMLERRIDELPVTFRTVFVLREVEELSVEEVSACLGIPPATVRTRLFRARALLREALARDLDHATGDVFAFAGDRCDRIVMNVLARVAAEDPGTSATPPASNEM